MKKYVYFLIAMIFIAFPTVVSHADEPALLNTVEVVFDITPSEGNTDFTAIAQLGDGVYLYEVPVYVSAESSVAVATFTILPFNPGHKFTFTIASGFDSVLYYNGKYRPGDIIELQTYSYLDYYNMPIHVTTFHMHAIPAVTKRIEYYKDFVPMNIMPESTYYDGVLYVPAAAGAKSIGISHIEYDIYTGKITYYILGKPIVLYVGSKSVSAFGSHYTLDREVITINQIPYIPLVSFAEIMEAKVIIQNEPDHINVVVYNSKVVEREIANINKTQYVNSSDLESETEYLIWVSKADFKVRVYKGSKNNWSLVKELTCSVGKESTPTCTGTYKFYERIKKWEYDKYYVGPVMRFNGGYAIHSTLISYDGTDYDNRVGMNLSAGCVRLQPADMNWLFDLIPLKTTIHVTNS